MRNMLKIIAGLIIVFGSFWVVYNFTSEGEEEIEVFPYTLEEDKVTIDKYYIYGTSFNIFGNINIDYEYEEISLFMYNEEEQYIPITYTNTETNITFQVSDLINKGFYIDTVPRSYYLLILKVKINEEEYKYYALDDITTYEDTTYYTMSNYNNKITIKKDSKYNTMAFEVVKNKDKKVYDIVIDPGHGGADPGAVFSGYKEKDINLKISLLLRDKLLNAGYKVYITRDSDVKIDNYNIDNNIGRIALIKMSNAKYAFSIHMNSSTSKNVNGVEIYTANDIDYALSRAIVDSIVNNTESNYSPNMTYKMYNGIYTRNMDEENLKNNIEDATKDGYEPYPINNRTCYYFIVREPGGIITGAYVDGRSSKAGINPYYNSNVGIESYLVEVGYLTGNTDLNNINNNIESYAEALAQAIIQNIALQ